MGAAAKKPVEVPEAARATTDSSKLAQAMALLTSVVERRNTIPILSHVLLSASDGWLSLRVTNLDIEATVRVEVQTEGAFSTTVDAHRFAEIAKAAAKGSQIAMTPEAGHLRITTGRSRWTLGTLPAEDFPAIAVGELPHGFSCKGQRLAHILNKVRGFAVTGSEEQVRYYLAGTFMHCPDGHAIFAATNGNMLGRVASDIAIADAPDVIIPSAMCALLMQVGSERQDELEISFSNSKIACESGDIRIVSKLIDGTFPDYTRVIPTMNDKRAVCDAQAMRDAIRRVSLIATEKVCAIKYEFESGKMVLSATSPDSGSAREEVLCEYDGDSLEIGFNHAFFAKMIDATGSENVTVHLADARAPTMFKETPEGEFTGVLMPIRV